MLPKDPRGKAMDIHDRQPLSLSFYNGFETLQFFQTLFGYPGSDYHFMTLRNANADVFLTTTTISNDSYDATKRTAFAQNIEI